MAGGTRTWETSTEKFLMPCFCACQTAIALPGAVVSKPMAKKTTFLSGLARAIFKRIDRRIDDAHIGAARFEHEQVDLRTRHAQHIAEGAENDVGPLRDGVRLVDHLQRGDANRAAGAMHELHFVRQQMIDAIFDDGVGLAAADLHQHPGSGDDARISLTSFPASASSRYSSRYFIA